MGRWEDSLFSCLARGEGKIGYKRAAVAGAEQRNQRLELRPPDCYLDHLSRRRGAGKQVLSCDGSLTGLDMSAALAELLSCQLLSTLAAILKRFFEIQVVTDITKGELFLNSVLWRAAECHCQVAEFLPHFQTCLKLQVHY
jgi:hypothetical protein